MAHLTDIFTFEAPLSPRVREAIATALDQGWAEPKKLSQASHRALELRTGAVDEIAAHLQISPAKIEVTGEPHLLPFLAINGSLNQESHLYTSAVDVGKIRAVARAHRGPSSEVSVARNGLISAPVAIATGDVVSLQAENGETGICQDLDAWRDLSATVVLDGTRTIPIPGLIDGFSIATFDAQSWNGPAGIGFLVINDSEGFRYPLPHIAPIRTPGSYSLPLLVGAAIALEEFKSQKSEIYQLRNALASRLSQLNGLTVIGEVNQQSRYLSVIVDQLSGEEVLRSLLQKGVTTDSGSACSPEDLAPSHVIGAMGYPTTGHLRFTVHPGMNESGVANLVEKISQVLTELRS